MTSLRQFRPGRGRLDLLLISGGAVTAQLLTLVSGPLVARMLGPDGRGQLALIFVISRMTAMLAAGGLPVAVAHAVGSARAPARDVIAERLRRWSYWSVVPATVATGATVVALGQGFSWLVVVPTAVITLCVQWNLMLSQMVRGEGSVSRVNALILSGIGLYVVGVALLFAFRPVDEVGYILVLLAVSHLVSTWVGWAMLRKPTHDESHRVSDPALYGFARRSFLSTINPVTLGVDQLILGLLLLPTDLGLYAAALSMTNLPVVLLSGVAAMLLPRMAMRGGAARAQLLHRWFAAALAIDLILVLALEVVIDPAIRILFGAGVRSRHPVRPPADPRLGRGCHARRTDGSGAGSRSRWDDLGRRGCCTRRAHRRGCHRCPATAGSTAWPSRSACQD